MDHTDLQAQIVQAAKDKFNHMVYPTRSNHPQHRAFRHPNDGQPLGFQFHGVDIEVHHTHFKHAHAIPSRRIPILTIIGIKGLKTHTIAEGVEAE